MNYDVFNGDADGIISLLQLRLAQPANNKLITGVKRDIELLKTVPVVDTDEVVVLDISMEKNISALVKLLDSGVKVFYADHHRSGDIPDVAHLNALIDLDPNVCTGLLVDKWLDGQFHLWAITAAYGDNLFAKADLLSKEAGLTEAQSEQLKQLGILINYNGYGSSVEDLHFHPAELYQSLLNYPSPFDLFADKSSPYWVLNDAYEADMANALAIAPRYEGEHFALFELPDLPWARRVSGVYGNHLANQTPDRANGVLTSNADNTYTVSLRAPLNNKQGAGDICSQFATGGGRAAAAGINALAKDDVKQFISVTERYYSGQIT
ncbi:DHH family phosphoesterase [Shewanella phaeophyticola]|uniref:DHH family phosphoesterase n=1 Tax=Shewanella phaeophyticola TaxID=2978345 RepID=A0ABT2P321_9GAMM|nr:DHH family phosphoesterase [Shewanella sp. KJ10-1]MCT8985765.1 DHH family phosphoesterase [Shewanella sp. KJ10-1]